MRDGDIDYSKYTLLELEEALAGINKHLYPENHKNLRSAYAKAGAAWQTGSAQPSGVTNDQPFFNLVQGAGLLWVVAAALHWLGAALSKMDTLERYNVQLGIVTGICVVAIVAALGAFAGYRWPRPVLILLSWSAAAFWLISGYSLLRSGDVLPILVGCFFASMAAVLHLAERQPSKHGA